MPTPLPFKYMEWVTVTIDGWELKIDAPENVRAAYKQFLKDTSMEISQAETDTLF